MYKDIRGRAEHWDRDVSEVLIARDIKFDWKPYIAMIKRERERERADFREN